MAFNELPEPIKNHLKTLAEELPDSLGSDILETLSDIWEKKEELYVKQAEMIGMERVGTVSNDDQRGLILLTYSGSLVSIGPGDDKRWAEYSSIHLRTDVPKIIVEEDIQLVSDPSEKKPLELTGRKLKKTSAVYMIYVCKPEVPLKEQDKRIREATVYLTNGFMKINRSLQLEDVPEQFTMKSMARYIGKKNNITGIFAKKILEDFFLLAETGMLLGEKVPLGRIGRLYVKKREPQKARVVRHPSTGEEITVKAKPSTAVPKISFSRYMKERSSQIATDDPDEL